MSESRVISQDVDIKKCRLCLCYEKLLLYLYEDSGMPKNVAKVISEMLQYKVSEMDGLPPYICTACSDKLWEFKAFKLMCDSAFEILFKERERRSEISSSYMNDNAVKEEPVINDFTSSQCNWDAANTQVQIFVESISIKEDEPVSCPANHFPDIMSEHQYEDPEGVLQPRESTNAHFYLSESMKSDKALNNRDFVPYANKLEDQEVERSKTSHIKTSSNQEVHNEKKYPKEVRIVDRGDEILNDSMIGSLNSLIDKTSSREVRSEELGDEIIKLRNYGVRNGQTVVLSSNTDTSPVDESVELSSDEKRTAKKMMTSSKNVGNFIEMEEGKKEIVPANSNSFDEFRENDLALVNSEKLLIKCGSIGESLHQNKNYNKYQKSILFTDEIIDGEKVVDSIESSTNVEMFEKTKLSKDEKQKKQVSGFISFLFDRKCQKDEDLEKDEEKVKGQQRSKSIHKHSSVIGVTSVGGLSEQFLDESTNESSTNEEMFEKSELSKEEKQKKQVSGLNSFLCDICGKVFHTGQSLRTHLNAVHVERKLSCLICDKQFKARHQLDQHSKTHSDIRTFICTLCNKQFRFEHHLYQHINSHTGKKMYSCTHCDMDFRTMHRLDAHQSSHDIEKQWCCIICRETSHTWAEHLEHTEMHTHGRRFGCATCGKKYKDKAELRRHTISHTDRYKCEICLKTFSKIYNLKKHRNTHTNENAHKCDICSEGFNRSYKLQMHLQIHTGKKIYHCQFCEWFTTDERRLKAHLKMKH